MEYLENARAIRDKLAQIYETPANGTAVVAFVGANAASYLPKDLTMLRIICWPKAGGTNPDGVRSLLDAGATIDFCDRLHSKIFHSPAHGAIIGSANLSDNALGENSLHEFAVFDPAPQFNIQSVIAGLGHLSAVNDENLDKLQLEHDLFWQRNPLQDSFRNTKRSFLDAATGAKPRNWKIVSYSEEREDNEPVRKAVNARFKQDHWKNDNDVRRSLFSEGDVVLQIKTNSEDIIKRPNATWFYVDHVAKRRGGEIIIQVNKFSPILRPFVVDARFKRVLMKTFNALKWEDVTNTHGYAQPALIDALKEAYSGDA